MSSASSVRRSSGEEGSFDGIEEDSFLGERSSDAGRTRGNSELEAVEGTDQTGDYSDESDFASPGAENKDEFSGSSGRGAENIEDYATSSNYTSDCDRSASLAGRFERQCSRTSEETESDPNASKSDRSLSLYTTSGDTSYTDATNDWIDVHQSAQGDEAEHQANEATYLKCVQGVQLSEESLRILQANEGDSGREDLHYSNAVHPTGSLLANKSTENINFDGEDHGDPVVSQASKGNRSNTTLDQRRAAAAKTIQCEVRSRQGFKLRANIRARKQGDAATKIQALARGRQLRWKYFSQTTEERGRYSNPPVGGRQMIAATQIQRKFRSGQRRARARATKRVTQEYGAAKRIQAVVRGWRTRLKGHTPREYHTKATIVSADAGENVRVAHVGRRDPGGSDDHGIMNGDETYSSTLHALGEHNAARRIQKQARRSIAKKNCAIRNVILSPEQGGRTLNELEKGAERYGKTFLTGSDCVAKKTPLGQTGRENGTAYRHEMQDMSSARGGQVPLGEYKAAKRIQRQMGRKIVREWRDIPVIRLQVCSEADDADGGYIRIQESRDGIDISRAGNHEGREGKAISMDEARDELHDFPPETERTTPRQLPPPREKLLGLISPGKVAATAAAAAANAAAQAAAVCTRAAEKAADAASAAAIAADAEEEALQLPPARSVFRETLDSRTKSTPERHSRSPNRKAWPKTRGSTDGDGGGVRIRVEALSRRVVHGNPGQDGLPGEGGGHFGEEDVLGSALVQARRYARDRRARALARGEESRRDLRAIETKLMKPEELRAKQAMVEKTSLEAKRARVLEDLRRHQQRLQRSQDKERQARPRSKADSSAGTGSEGQPTRARLQDCNDSGKSPSEVVTLLSPLRSLRAGLQAQPRRNKGRHLSAFRQRILGERWVSKKAVESKQEELKQKPHRQSDYGAKIRAQARKALAAVRPRHQACGRPSRVDQPMVRTSVVTKVPGHDGNWGVFSYAPSRPKSGTKKSGTGGSPMHDGPAVGFGSTGRVHTRPETSEMIERMKRARVSATEANRAQAMARCWRRRRHRRRCGSNGVNWRNDSRYVQPRAAEGARLEGKKGYSFGTYVPVEVEGRKNLRNRRSRGSQWPDQAPKRGIGSTNDQNYVVGDDGCNHVGNFYTARYFGRSERAKAHKRPSASEDVYAMYEERLAALERRVAAGCKYHRSADFEASSRNATGRRGVGVWGLEPNLFRRQRLSTYFQQGWE